MNADSKANKNRVLSKVEKSVAIGLIGGFVIMVCFLIAMRADEHWERLIFVFGSVEALVFAAAGALFGTSIQRAQTASAEESAERSRSEAERTRTELDKVRQSSIQARLDAKAGQLLKEAVLQKATTRAPTFDVMQRSKLANGEASVIRESMLMRDIDELAEIARSI